MSVSVQRFPILIDTANHVSGNCFTGGLVKGFYYQLVH